jgi:nitroreductase
MVPMSALLNLSPDELLRTTRAVRRRLDFTRPVGDDVVRELVAIALQAPSGTNKIRMRFIVVRDEATRRAIGEIFAELWAIHRDHPVSSGESRAAPPTSAAQEARFREGGEILGRHLGEAPVIVIGCTEGRRTEGLPGMSVAMLAGNIMPAMWSFMLGARARGLGTCWTTMHLERERQIADLLGVPYERVQQYVLTPLAYTRGTDFRPAPRPDPDAVIHWDRWQA